MILRRIALFIALLFALALTQVPEFIEQYRQRLGGAIDELAAAVSNFDSKSAQVGLDEAGGLDRLKKNSDALARADGAQMQETIERLARLREAQLQFKTEGPIARLATFVTHYDPRLARGTYADFEPAVPTSPEAFVLGLVGFVFGGGVVHMAGRPLRRRVRQARHAETVA